MYDGDVVVSCFSSMFTSVCPLFIHHFQIDGRREQLALAKSELKLAKKEVKAHSSDGKLQA